MYLVHNSTALDFTFVPAAERPEAFGPFIPATNSYNGLRALSLQRLAGSWLTSFNVESREPDFRLDNYVAKLATVQFEAERPS